ncbi:MAG TPA: phosphoenolpyruvate-utilizing N-terminal domain-containing protein, partial [Candidatus Dormibacteraeota bacterium]|nr:phosphoenolpyruvate-utilizing N-terminal domain-containing protein [Candidatus Dormibacteraeota bacterium]
MIGETPTRIPAVAAAPGIARARWAELRRTALPAPRQIGATEAAAEIERLNAAANEAAMELMALSDRVAEEGHEAESAIFAAHAAIAWDPALMAAATEEIESKRTDAIGGIVAAGRTTAATLAAVDDALISARSADILDVADRIARRLAG